MLAILSRDATLTAEKLRLRVRFGASIGNGSATGLGFCDPFAMEGLIQLGFGDPLAMDSLFRSGEPVPFQLERGSGSGFGVPFAMEPAFRTARTDPFAMEADLRTRRSIHSQWIRVSAHKGAS